MEKYIVTIGEREGHRHVQRFPLNIDLSLARGHLERMSDRAVNDLINDLRHEQHRRTGLLAQLGGWDPRRSQIRRRKSELP